MKIREAGTQPRKRNIFKRFLISYIFILIIPITIGSYSYFGTIKQIESNTITSEILMIRQVQSIVDKYLQAVELSVYSLYVNQSVLTISNIDQPQYGSDKVYQIMSVIEDMKQKNIVGTLESTTYLILKKPDMVISSSSAYQDIRKFYENNLQYESMSFDEWYTYTLEQSQSKSILPSQNISQKTGSGKTVQQAITYTQSIPKGAIVVLIDTTHITKLLSDILVSDEGFALIVDNDNNIIAKSNSKIETGNFLDLDELSMDQNVQYKTVNGKETIIFIQQSTYKTWKYIYVIPKNDIMSQAQQVKKTLILNLVIILTVGCLVSIFLTRKDVRPVHEIISSLGNIYPVERNQDEYALIKHHILKLININDSLSLSMKNQNKTFKNVFLYQLLNGTVIDSLELRKVMSFLGFNLEGNRYAVIIVTLNRRMDAFANSNLDEKAIKSIADSVLVKNIYGNGCTYLMEPGQIVVILYYDNNDDMACMNLIKQYILVTNKELVHTYTIFVEFGVGNLYGNLLDVNFSYSEAKVALQQLGGSEVAGSAIWYSDLPAVDNQYYYPLDMEELITNMVKSGKKTELGRILRYLHGENFKNRALPFNTQLQLFYEMKATLLKIKGEINYTTWIEVFESLNLRDVSAEEFMQEFAGALDSLCDIINQNKKSHNQELLEEIQTYLLENYNDSEISLYNLSSRFKISNSYMSQFFKDQTGQNLSDYLEKIRIRQACKLLHETSLTVVDIIGKVGYNNTYSFRRAFKRSMGQSPNEYRRSIVAAELKCQ